MDPTFRCRNVEAKCTLCEHPDHLGGRLGEEEGEGEGGGLGQQEVEDRETSFDQKLGVRVHWRDKIGKAGQGRNMIPD